MRSPRDPSKRSAGEGFMSNAKRFPNDHGRPNFHGKPATTRVFVEPYWQNIPPTTRRLGRRSVKSASLVPRRHGRARVACLGVEPCVTSRTPAWSHPSRDRERSAGSRARPSAHPQTRRAPSPQGTMQARPRARSILLGVYPGIRAQACTEPVAPRTDLAVRCQRRPLCAHLTFCCSPLPP